MRKTNVRSPLYSMQIICEGIHTEPNFYGAFVDQLREEGKIDYAVKICPKPTIHPKDNKVDLKRGGGGRQKRKVKKDTDRQKELDEEDKFFGEPPLNWVNAGLEALNIYNEVWVVFDKDRHPKTEAAFEKAAATVIDGKKLGIVFSSRCFEYYLLLHFELIYKAFEKAECNGKVYSGKNKGGKTISFHCMTAKAVEGKACHGDKCINGYARLKKYWTDSKGNSSTFDIVKERLWTGISNSHAIRWKSNLNAEDIPIYMRNPYTNADKLTCRLMGYHLIEDGDIISIQNGRDTYSISRKIDLITIKLTSQLTTIIPHGNIVVISNSSDACRTVIGRIILSIKEPTFTIDLKKIMDDSEHCVITISNESYVCVRFPLRKFIDTRPTL